MPLEKEVQEIRKRIQDLDNALENDDDLIKTDQEKIEDYIPGYNDYISSKFIEASDAIDSEYVKTMDDVEEELQEKIEKYLEDNEEFTTKMVNKFKHLLKNEKKDRRFTYKKIRPYVIATGMALSLFLGAKIGQKVIEDNHVTFDTSFDNIYGSINESPKEVLESYVEDQIDAYYSAEPHEEYKSREFEEAYRNFESELQKVNPDLRQLREYAKIVSDLSGKDEIDATKTYKETDYTKSRVIDGNVYLPVKDEKDLTTSDELTVIEGSLFKKRL